MGGCDCNDVEGLEPGELCQIRQHRQPVARKEHRCSECGKPITVGERYHYFFGWNVEPRPYKRGSSWKVCVQCELDWALLENYLDSSCGRMYGEFSNCLGKALDEELLESPFEAELLASDGSARPVCSLVVRWHREEALGGWIQVVLEQLNEMNNFQERLAAEYRAPHKPQPFLRLVREYVEASALAQIFENLGLTEVVEPPPRDAPGQISLFEEEPSQ